MGVVTKNGFPHLSIEDKCLLLDGHKIKAVESFEIKKSCGNNSFPGTAELTLKMIVKYP